MGDHLMGDMDGQMAEGLPPTVGTMTEEEAWERAKTLAGQGAVIGRNPRYKDETFVVRKAGAWGVDVAIGKGASWEQAIERLKNELEKA